MDLATGKVCIECGKFLARHWGNNFCEACFRKLLKESLIEEDKHSIEKKN